MNEQYEEFAVRKINGIDFNEQQPILYAIKPLVPKIPEYTQMNNRLKSVRIRKILEGKNICGKTKVSDQILNLNSYHSQ